MNISMCYFKQKKYDLVIRECSKILEISSLDTASRVKVHFRRGQAHLEEKDTEAALKNLGEAYRLDQGKDAGVAKAFIQLRDQIKQLKEEEKKRYMKMFS